MAAVDKVDLKFSLCLLQQSERYTHLSAGARFTPRPAKDPANPLRSQA